MSDKIKIEIGGQEKDIELKKEGKMTILELPLKIEVSEGNFLHIGAAPSPLTEKKGAVFKVDRIPVIPATSFKGALRHHLELLLIEKVDEFAHLFNIPDDKKDSLKPCIPSPDPSKAEKELVNIGYRKQLRKGRKAEIITEGCWIEVDKDNIRIPPHGICPVCYFMGTTGLMGFLRFSNFYPESEGSVVDQTNIRIDRKTGTAAKGAKVEGEQVKPGTVFKGSISIIISEPILEMQGLQFGDARKISDNTIDKWLEHWNEEDKINKTKTLIEKVLLPTIQNIKVLGGQKSRGAGMVNVQVG